MAPSVSVIYPNENTIIKAFAYFKSDTNPNSMETDLPISTWTKELELAGEKLDAFLNQVRIAIAEM